MLQYIATKSLTVIKMQNIGGLQDANQSNANLYKISLQKAEESSINFYKLQRKIARKPSQTEYLSSYFSRG